MGSLDDPRLGVQQREQMVPYGQHSCLTVPLVSRDRAIGVVDLIDYVEREFTAEEIATAEAIGQQVAQALDNAQLYEEVRRLHLGNLRALSSALSAKDYYTLGHASRVAAYTALLGRELGWPEQRLEAVENAAFLHDIGKIGVSDRVLLKAGPLTSEEWELMRQHPGISAEIVRPLFDEELVAGVRHHHERFDGLGYPDGLAGDDIPLTARALCVVDCYDAMSCQRPYRQALSYEQCVAELERCAGTQFDPAMVESFRRVLVRLQRRRALVEELAAEAARGIDPAAHALLRTHADQARPEYVRMVGALRELRDANPPVRFISSFALRGEQCVSVLDTGETEDDLSRCGDPWLPEDGLARVLAGESLLANVLNADDYGVWVSGIAPVLDAEGEVVAAVTVDAPAVESRGWSAEGDRSQTLAAMLRAATIRFSRAEVEAITDGLTGLYNHRYLHERLEEELERCRSLRGRALGALLRLRPLQGVQRRPRPQDRRRGPGAHRAHLRGQQPPHRPGGALRRRGVRARARGHRRGGRARRRRDPAPRDRGGQRAPRAPPHGQHRRRHLPRRRRLPGRAPRQGRLGDVRGQARRPQPGAGLLRRSRAQRDVALAAREIASLP